MADTVDRGLQFFLIRNIGYDGSPEDIIKKLKHEWIEDNPFSLVGYCISSKVYHMHMALEDSDL